MARFDPRSRSAHGPPQDAARRTRPPSPPASENYPIRHLPGNGSRIQPGSGGRLIDLSARPLDDGRSRDPPRPQRVGTLSAAPSAGRFRPRRGSIGATPSLNPTRAIVGRGRRFSGHIGDDHPLGRATACASRPSTVRQCRVLRGIALRRGRRRAGRCTRRGGRPFESPPQRMENRAEKGRAFGPTLRPPCFRADGRGSSRGPAPRSGLRLGVQGGSPLRGVSRARWAVGQTGRTGVDVATSGLRGGAPARPARIGGHCGQSVAHG